MGLWEVSLGLRCDIGTTKMQEAAMQSYQLHQQGSTSQSTRQHCKLKGHGHTMGVLITAERNQEYALNSLRDAL